MNRRTVRSARRAFTIIEVMIVLVILGLIGGIVTLNLVGAADDAKIETTKQSMQQVAGGLTMYRTRNNDYPATDTWKSDLRNTFSGDLEDAWGNELVYFQTEDGKAFQLWSNGPDGVPETEDDILVEPDHE
jgi:general secretion pathway protein G